MWGGENWQSFGAHGGLPRFQSVGPSRLVEASCTWCAHWLSCLRGGRGNSPGAAVCPPVGPADSEFHAAISVQCVLCQAACILGSSFLEW